MDRVIEKKKGIQKKHLPYILGGGLLLAFLVWLIFGNHQASLRIDSRSIIVGEAKQGQFNTILYVLTDRFTHYHYSAGSPRRRCVEQKVVEEGATVRRGDVIVRLSNSQLNLQILESEASLAEKENFLRNTLVTMEQEKTYPAAEPAATESRCGKEGKKVSSE
jgi:HlyD family secretion protein